MSVTPYRPIHPEPLATESDIAAMHAKLAAKVKPKVEVMPVEQQTSAGKDAVAAGAASAENTLQWETPEEKSRLIYTVDRKYRCRKWSNEQAGREPVWKYQLEKLVEDSWYYACGPICDSFREIRRLAQADSEKSR